MVDTRATGCITQQLNVIILHRKINPSFVEEVALFQNMCMSRRVMDLEEAEARNDCADKGQQSFN
jgi:hypothetical protein